MYLAWKKIITTASLIANLAIDINEESSGTDWPTVSSVYTYSIPTWVTMNNQTQESLGRSCNSGNSANMQANQ